MKTAQRIAMRAKNRNRWQYDSLSDDEPQEYLEWHEERALTTWTPSPEETAATQAYLDANPGLPF